MSNMGYITDGAAPYIFASYGIAAIAILLLGALTFSQLIDAKKRLTMLKPHKPEESAQNTQK